MVPFSRNTNFVARSKKLAYLRSKLEGAEPGGHRRLALCGLGGVGYVRRVMGFGFTLARDSNATQQGSGCTRFLFTSLKAHKFLFSWSMQEVQCDSNRITPSWPNFLGFRGTGARR